VGIVVLLVGLWVIDVYELVCDVVLFDGMIVIVCLCI